MSSRREHRMALSRGRIAGFVEQRSGDVIRGWAFNQADPGHSVRLVMYIDGQPVSEVVCNVPRPDLSQAGVPRPDCGFEWLIPATALDGRRHLFAARTPEGAPLPFRRSFSAQEAWERILAPSHTPRHRALFDSAFYLAQNPDVAAAKVPALEHFVQSGDREGRAPHPLFDSRFYSARHQVPAGMGPLEHYLRSGGIGSPHPLFDGEFYSTAYPDTRRVDMTPLEHYLCVGAVRGYDPHPAFDTAYYLDHCPEPGARANPLLHYVLEGSMRGLSPHRLFDPAYYATQPSGRAWDGTVLPRRGLLISVIVPVHDTPPQVLQDCIESVRRQSYTSWELCLFDDGSRDPRTVAMLAAYRGTDPRIRVERSTTNVHIARATNRAAMQASGEFLAFLDHDDLLEPEALAEVAAAVRADPTIDLLYTDEDKIDPEGRRCEPYQKPDWSPEHLHSVMYMLHMLVVRKSVFWAVNGSRPERTGAQDYDLALRVARVARRVHHIPRILYHWRMLPGSASAAVDVKPYALQAGRAALQDDVDDAGLDARVEDGLIPGTFRVRRNIPTDVPVTLLILTHDAERDVPGRGRINLVRNFVRSIVEKSTYRNIRLVVVGDCNSSVPTKRLLKQVGAQLLPYSLQGSFNYAHKANSAIRAVQTEQIIILNDDLEVISPDWIEALLEQSMSEEVGGVGARLLYPDGRIQHSGIILGVHGATGHAFWNLPREVVGYNNYTHVIRNYSAVTGAVFATRRGVLEEVGGFDERLSIDYNDVDLCLRIGQTGRRIVFTPFCELYHFEGSTAVRTTQKPEERALFTARWGAMIARDPFYSPYLPRDRLTFA